MLGSNLGVVITPKGAVETVEGELATLQALATYVHIYTVANM